MPTEDDEHLIEVAGWLFGSAANQALARRKCSLSVVSKFGESRIGLQEHPSLSVTWADCFVRHLERIQRILDFPQAVRYDAAIGLDPTMITCGVEHLLAAPGGNPGYVYDTFSNTFEQIDNSGNGAYQGCLNPASVQDAPAIYATSVVSNTQNVASLNVIHICRAMLNVMVEDPLLMTLSAQIEDLERWLRSGRTSTMDKWRWMDHFLLHEMGHSPLLGNMNTVETEVYRWGPCVAAKDPANPGEWDLQSSQGRLDAELSFPCKDSLGIYSTAARFIAEGMQIAQDGQ